jgi:2-oxoglutarate ferredoxin oxidoreductase subunit gamma
MIVSEDAKTRQSATIGVRFGGVGGQGIVLAGRLLGKAAALFDGKDAVCTQSYGPEARGGASRADVVISDHRVNYPFVAEADILAVFFQEAYAMFRSKLRPGGMLLIDKDLVDPADDQSDVHAIAATRIAEELGTKMAANVVMLGYIVGLTGIVSRESVEEAIRVTVKPKIVELNLEAFDAGMRLAIEERAA